MGVLVTDPECAAAAGEDCIDEEAEEGEILSFSVSGSGSGRLDSWLASVADGFSRSRIQGLIKAGFVYLNGTQAQRANTQLQDGDTVCVHVPPPVPAVPVPQDIPLNIVYEDESVIVVDKPAGLVVHPAPGHPDGTLVNAILHHCPSLAGIGGVARPGIVHRLDRDTSGLMVVAKTAQAMASLAHNFHKPGGIRKIYRTLVHGCPQALSGTVENLIGRSPADRKKMAIVRVNGKNAVTHWKTVGRYGALSLVECLIDTGRTHQIRVHMASLGCPVAGDATYGKPARDKMLSPVPQRQLLHAFRLAFPHPAGGREMAFESPLPADFAPYMR